MQINKTWTIFLDRDGVINKRLINDYVKTWDEFDFLPGVLEALKIISNLFERVIVVTNQQGIGKGLMTEHDLEQIHNNMIGEIEKNEGRIDEIIFCPDLATEEPNCRKPNPTMGHIAKSLHPKIDFKHSLMVGDTEGDILFGKNLGMKTIFIGNTDRYKKLTVEPNNWYQGLLEFSVNYQKSMK